MDTYDEFGVNTSNSFNTPPNVIEQELRKVLEYILDNEANHFNAWCGDGNNPNDHIYMSALKVHDSLK